MRSALLFILLCPCLTAQDAASIEGVAIDAVTRQPMTGVHITMRSDSVPAYGAISRKDGHFSIANMAPAVYFLTAQRNGYIHLPGKIGMRREDENVALNPGQELTDFTVEMTPRAVIAGRVVDEYGDPVQYAEVEAVPTFSGPQMERFGMNDTTDERGQFRMTGPPGKFFVRAMPRRDRVGRPEIRADGLTPPVYGVTYYPASGTKDRATVVEVAAGHDLAGIDIHLTRKLSLTIGGVVTGAPDRSAPGIIRIFAEGPDQSSVGRLAQPDADGKFTASGLAPGHYWLLAGSASENGGLQSPVVEVQLVNTDETGVILHLSKGEALSGTIEIPGDWAEKPAVRLEPASRADQLAAGGDTKGSEVDKDGAFRIESVFPGTFRVRVLPLPENAYIKSVKLGDAEAPGGVLDLSRGVGGAKVKVSISLNGGQVEGTVFGEDGQPFERPLPFVILAETVDEINGSNLKLADAGAKFKYTGLRPGKYRLIAVDPRQYGGDIDAVKAIFPKVPEIEIREGDRITKDVKIIAVENPGAQP